MSTSTISTVIALPYEIARRPLVAVDATLTSRLSETAVPRTVVDRAIGTADRVAGTVLRNPGIARRGSERLERSDKLLAAARLEKEAAARREQAEETITEGVDEAARRREAAARRATDGLREADATQAREKAEAEAAAEKKAAEKKAAADRRAAKKKADVEQRKDQVDAAARNRKKAAQAEAKTELEQARETKQAARKAKADADTLDELAERKKQDRTQD